MGPHIGLKIILLYLQFLHNDPYRHVIKSLGNHLIEGFDQKAILNFT